MAAAGDGGDKAGAAPAKGGAAKAAGAAAAADEGTHTAVQIIGLDKAGTSFELLEKNLDSVLAGASVRNLPAVVVSVAGPFRLGKSFLLNYFVRYLEGKEDVESGWVDQSFSPDHNLGFNWSHGADRHTTGVWMYKKPFIRTLPGGKKVAVLLVDTQGTFDNNTRQEMNAIIFALNSLLSSVQVYNVSKRIGEDVLQNMHLFTRFGQMAYNRQSGGKSKGAEGRAKIKPFQRLQFLVRDWGGKKDFPFGAAGGEGYLETVLNQQEGEQELVEVRRDIKDCFADIDCFLMPYPGEPVAEGDSGEIEERFREHLEAFVPSVLRSSALVVKKVLGHQVTCGSLKELIREYTRVFKDGSMPEVTNIFDATAKINHDGIRRTSVALYKSEMHKLAGPEQPFVDPALLKAKHKEAHDGAMKAYQETDRLEAPRVEKDTLEAMTKEIDELYSDLEKSNAQKALFKRLVTPIAMVGLVVLCYIFSAAFSIVGIDQIVTLLGYVQWLCWLTVAFWAYSNASHNFEDVAKEIDKVSMQMYEVGESVLLPFLTQRVLEMAKKKD